MVSVATRNRWNNSSLSRAVQGSLESPLLALNAALEARDAYTLGHSRRVANLGFQLAQQFGSSAEFCYEVFLAGLLHDVGKIGIPDAILLKATKLTDGEFQAIQQHPEIGYRIVEPFHELSFTLPGILHHHERWDGGGYPHGIGGEVIPLIARILAVVDAYDAMTSSRSYRAAMPPSRAFAILAEGRGTQWDASLVDCLPSCFAENRRRLDGKHVPVESHHFDTNQRLYQAIMALSPLALDRDRIVA